MAKIIENLVVLRLSKLARDDDNTDQSLISQDDLRNLEEVVQSLVDKGIVVELIVE